MYVCNQIKLYTFICARVRAGAVPERRQHDVNKVHVAIELFVKKLMVIAGATLISLL